MTTRERYGSDRIIAFSDAVVAIAITVLLLPLAEVRIPEGGDLVELIRQNSALLWGLTLSWVIIAIFWLAHHRLFDHIAYFDAITVRLNFVWLFVIALMPLPTNILIENDPTTQTVGFYIGWMLLTSALLMLIQFHARRTPGMMDSAYLQTREAAEARVRSLLITGVFAVCLVMAFIAPNTALWFLLLQIPVDWIAGRWAARGHA